MAMRFMKVKRVVIPLLTVVIMLSQLSGCAVATPEDIVDLPSEVTLVIEEAELTDQNEVKQYDTDNKQYDTDSKHEKGEIGKEEMLRLFGQFYSDYKKDKVSMDNEMFLITIITLVFLLQVMLSLPFKVRLPVWSVQLRVHIAAIMLQ